MTKPERRKQVIVGITGASGAVYARGLLRCLCEADTDVHLIVSPNGQRLLREELERVASFRLNQLKLLLRPLEVIANLAPLLGLLGTVLGMIVAFQNMEAAGSRVDPSVLSGGIWQALLTTAVGLAVAIPTVAVHSWLERRVERVAAAINDAVTQVFTHQPKSQSNASGKVANAA